MALVFPPLGNDTRTAFARTKGEAETMGPQTMAMRCVRIDEWGPTNNDETMSPREADAVHDPPFPVLLAFPLWAPGPTNAPAFCPPGGMAKNAACLSMLTMTLLSERCLRLMGTLALTQYIFLVCDYVAWVSSVICTVMKQEIAIE